jgi:N-ethylmaleimide reductase
MTTHNSALFAPLQLGDLTLPNRIVMAPLTRNRATHGTDAPNASTALYYEQRATAGLLITEASQISQQGQGYVWTPGIYTDAQVEGWRGVTDAVHAKGGRIFIQLWHVGRISHVSLQPGGGQPVAPSAIPAKGKTYIENGFAEVSKPRALELAEIPGIVADFVHAAEMAKRAGFDGIELHAANGYLLEQFIKDGANKRDDAYGGSIENRARLTLEVVAALTKVWDPGRIGIRLSPVTPANDITISDPQPMYDYLVAELNRFNLGYLHVVEGATGGPRDVAPFDYTSIRRAFKGVYIANNGYSGAMAAEAVASHTVDAVAFGKAFIANPDLVERLRVGAPLNTPDQKTFYGGGEHGYTDYPTLASQAA